MSAEMINDTDINQSKETDNEKLVIGIENGDDKGKIIQNYTEFDLYIRIKLY